MSRFSRWNTQKKTIQKAATYKIPHHSNREPNQSPGVRPNRRLPLSDAAKHRASFAAEWVCGPFLSFNTRDRHARTPCFRAAAGPLELFYRFFLLCKCRAESSQVIGRSSISVLLRTTLYRTPAAPPRVGISSQTNRDVGRVD